MTDTPTTHPAIAAKTSAEAAAAKLRTVADLAWQGAHDVALREVDACMDLLREVRSNLNRAKCQPRPKVAKQPKKAPSAAKAVQKLRAKGRDNDRFAVHAATMAAKAEPQEPKVPEGTMVAVLAAKAAAAKAQADILEARLAEARRVAYPHI